MTGELYWTLYVVVVFLLAWIISLKGKHIIYSLQGTVRGLKNVRISKWTFQSEQIVAEIVKNENVFLYNMERLIVFCVIYTQSCLSLQTTAREKLSSAGTMNKGAANDPDMSFDLPRWECHYCPSLRSCVYTALCLRTKKHSHVFFVLLKHSVDSTCLLQAHVKNL